MSKPNVPIIVASFQSVNQTVSLPDTAIFTPATTGVYRLSAYLEQSSGGSGNIVLTWTNDLGLVDFVATSGGSFSQTLTAFASLQAGQPVLVRGGNGPTFSIFAAVEDMN